jgi:hypothetical protein
MNGEKIYEYEFDITGVTDFGVSMDAILAAKEPIPLQGARFDLAVDGRGNGRHSGRVHGVDGVDYIRVRADGRIELDLHVTVETDDGRLHCFVWRWPSGAAKWRANAGYLCKHPSLDGRQRICMG